jgi:hypothetical protein
MTQQPCPHRVSVFESTSTAAKAKLYPCTGDGGVDAVETDDASIILICT